MSLMLHHIVHIRKHNRMGGDLECPICSETFTLITQFGRHAWSCAKIRPFGCPFRCCEFAATQKWTLKKHLLSKVHQLSICSDLVLYIFY